VRRRRSDILGEGPPAPVVEHQLRRENADEVDDTVTGTLLVNRAPVLTLWASIVAERLGHPRATALTLGKAVAGLNAQAKGRRLGIYEEPPKEAAKEKGAPAAPHPASISLLGREVPVKATAAGVRAIAKGKPEDPAAVERYLTQKFGASLAEVEAAMRALAKAYPPKRLAVIGFDLYEQFRPAIPEGVRGWGAKGALHLGTIRALAKEG